MRKTLILMTAVLLLTACSSEPECVVTQNENMSTVYSLITEDEAIEIALKAKTDLTINKSRSTYSVEKVRVVKNHLSRGNDETPLLYIVDFDDNEGCAVVCAHRTDEQVLALTETGYLNFTDSGNPGAKMFMDKAVLYANGLVVNPIDTLQPNMRYWEERVDTLVNINVPQRIHLSWHQMNPLNRYSPIVDGMRAPTYCVPLATAMTMSYFKYPASLELTFPGYYGQTLNLDWDGIRTVLPSYRQSIIIGGDTDVSDYTDMAALLVREIGYRTNTIYDPSENGDSIVGTKMINALSFLNTQGFSYVKHSTMPDMDINRESIILVESKGMEHGFLIDGQKRLHTKMYEIIYEQLSSNLKIEISRELIKEVDINYAHVNWGWGGLNNGYFSANVLNTAYPYELDLGPIYGYNIHEEVIYGGSDTFYYEITKR